MTDRKVLALASPALRRDVACPTLFRQAKRVNKQRVSQKTVERLISEGLLPWGNASRTFVVLTERGTSPETGLDLRAVAAFTRPIAESEEPEEMNERPRRAYRYRRRRRKGPSQAPARSARPCVAGASRCGRSVKAGRHGKA